MSTKGSIREQPTQAADGLVKAPEYVVYKRRFIGMVVIVLLNIATGFVWLSYASVANAAKEYLNCSAEIVNITSILYFIAYVVMGPVAGWVFENWGIRKALFIGGSIQALGALLRYLAHYIDSTPQGPGGRLALTFVGQLIAASAQPFFLSAPPKYAALWFSENGRATATMVGSVSNALGAAVAQVIIPILTKDAATMKNTTLFCVIISAVAILPIVVIADKPPTPPSPSAAEALKETEEVPFWVSLKRVGSNKQFLVLTFLFATFLGFFNSFSSLINQFTSPYGYTADEAGYFGAAMILAGLIGAGAAGVFIDKTKKFKQMLKSVVPLIAILYIVFIFIVRRNFFVGIIIVSGLLGLTSFSLLPVVLEYGIEMTYPEPPSSSVSLLWAAGQALAVIFLLILQALQNDAKSQENLNPPLIFIGAWASASSFLVIFINAPYKRLEAEARVRRGMQETAAGDNVDLACKDVDTSNM